MSSKNAILRNRPLSLRNLVVIYSFGALLALCLAFSPALGQMRALHCLLLSWALGLGALFISTLEGREFEQACEDCLKSRRD